MVDVYGFGGGDAGRGILARSFCLPSRILKGGPVGCSIVDVVEGSFGS